MEETVETWTASLYVFFYVEPVKAYPKRKFDRQGAKAERIKAAVDSHTPPSPTFMNQSPQARAWRALCLLSFDGGGIRGLSSLFILREIMCRLNGELQRSDPQHQTLHPWQIFDLICGTSTGGLIAIMLGRLHMSVDETIEAYAKLAGLIFSETKWWWKEGRYKASRLERAINITSGTRTSHDSQTENTMAVTQRERDDRDAALGKGLMMGDPHEGEDRCPVFVCAVPADNIGIPSRLRTYPVVANATPNCAIWEAARATSAAPYFFKPAIILENTLETRYVDGGLRCNNPTVELLNEAAEEFSGRHLGCLLSLGTGQKNVIRLRPAGGIPKLQLIGMPKVLQKISTDCEEIHNQLAARFHGRGVYFRFNVEQGLQGVGLEEWKRLSQVQAHTSSYTRSVQTTHEIDSVVRTILDRRAIMTVEQAAGR